MKAHQRHALERIYRRTVPPDEVITPELANFMAGITADLRRQVGVLIDRRGHVQRVIVGDSNKLQLPDLGRQRAGRSRFRGVRLVHTHVRGEPLSRDDITDLSLLQLDLIAVLQVDDGGRADTIELAHLMPPGPGDALWETVGPSPLHDLQLPFDAFIDELESSFATARRGASDASAEARAVAVHVATGKPGEAPWEQSLAELEELATTARIEIVEKIVQRRREPDHRYVMGRGKLEDLILITMQQEADLVIFDRDLTPSQARSIADLADIRVIDRTQLILDIFARRATTRDGKLQVELAQLKYTLPRLAGSNKAMSRLMGGIGGRGPGESKLEIDRRRAKDRIAFLQKRIDKLSRQREQRRQRRRASRLPVASIVGYTNAGKSTLLNVLTGSEVLAEDRLFATLDPTTRRLRFPNETEVVLTDTVGFIRDLPEDLVAAFRATLEELDEADLLIHVVDISSTGWQDRIEAVEGTLEDLDLHQKPTLLVFNKVDRVEDRELLATLCRVHSAIPTCGLDRSTLRPLTDRLVAFANGSAPTSVQVGG